MTLTGDAEWFTRTGHCGKCGQPGDFCLCSDRDPCGCQDLHRVGAGRDPGALATFTTPGQDQDGLF